MLVRAFGATDVGRKRTNNEDAFTLRPEHNLYVVADGMGGTPRARWPRSSP